MKFFVELFHMGHKVLVVDCGNNPQVLKDTIKRAERAINRQSLTGRFTIPQLPDRVFTIDDWNLRIGE